MLVQVTVTQPGLIMVIGEGRSMLIVKIHQAKNDLSEPVDEVVNGEELIAAPLGHSIVRLTPRHPLRRSGLFAGWLFLVMATTYCRNNCSCRRDQGGLSA